MFPSKRAVLNLGNGVVHANPLHIMFRNKYVAAFTSMSDINKDLPTTHDKLSDKDATVEGSTGGFGIFTDEDEAVDGGSQSGYGGSGIPVRSDKSIRNRRDRAQERRPEDMDMGGAARDTAEMAKAGIVGAMETGLKLGEMAKQTMDGMWDVAKKTTESVRDSVADDNGGNIRHGKEPSDKHVEDLRRWSRGTDLKD